MKKTLLFLIAFILFSFQSAYATHALGGDLMYEQIAPNQYLITLRIYRDCGGISLSNNATINWSGTCGNGSATVTRISNIDITPLCPGLPTACSGGSGTIGIEEHVFTATVTVPPGCNDISFNYSLCCRNLSITTLIHPNGENIFLYAEHFNTNIINHSPFFNNYPSPIVCVNQPVVYNHGVFDPDGDSLYFFQGDCYEGLNNPVEYSAGYSGVVPLTTVNPIVLNPNTGAITFTPNLQQVGVMCIVVQEFRNGILIGETIRDIQFNVIACGNVPPVSSGINNQPGVDSLDFMISICQNSLVCFDLSFSDIDLDDLTVSWNQEINDATFQVFNNNTTNPTAQFCWSPNASDLGLNFFSINIQDDACPLVANSTYTYTVRVLPNPNSMSLAYDNTVCIADTNQIMLSTLPNAPDSVFWSLNPTLNQTSLLTADVFPSGTAVYAVEAYFPDGCLASDTASFVVSTPPTINASANTTNICNGGTIVLTGSGGTSYSWNNGAVDGLAFIPPVGITTYTVTGVGPNSCTNQDSIQVAVNPILKIIALPGSSLCYGDYVTLDAQGALNYVWDNGVVDGVAFMPPVGTTNYIVTGTDVNGCVSQDSIDITVNPLPLVNGSSDALIYCDGVQVTLIGQYAETYTWDNGVIDNVPFMQALGTIIYTLTAADSLGCVNQDTVSVTVSPLPSVAANTNVNNVCQGVPVSLTGSGALSYTWNNGVIDGLAFLAAVGTQTYVVTGIDANGCSNQDSIDITVNPLPNVVASSTANIICDGFSTNLTGSGAQTYIWDNGLADGVSFVPSLGTTTYKVLGTDVNGCTNQDSIDIIVNPLPQIAVIASANTNNICAGQSLTLTATGTQSFSWNNGISNGIAFTPAIGTTTYIVSGVDSNACIAYDTVLVRVNSLPSLTIQASDSVVCSGESITLSGLGAQFYAWDNGIFNGVSFVPALGTTPYTLSAVDTNGCEQTMVLDILVNPLPIISANTSNNNVCLGSSIILSGSGATSYIWDNGVSNGIAFNPILGTTNFTVLGTDINACVNSAVIDISVNPLPVINISSSANGNTLCEGEALQLIANGAQSYTWNNGVSNGVSFIPPLGSTTYVVTATDSNGCITIDSIGILVNPLPMVNVAASANNICEGTSIILSGSGASAYTWNNGITDGVAFTPSVGTTNYVLTGTDSNGCVNTDSIAIVVNPLPTVVANTDGNNICDGFDVTLTGFGAQSYVWDNGIYDGIAFIPAEGTSAYTVFGTDVNGCVNQASMDIIVNALPQLTITASSNGNALCEGDSLALNGSGALSYAWNNNVVDGVSFVPPVGNSSYLLTAVDSNACVNSDSLSILVNALPNLNINPSGNGLCDGESLTLNGGGAQSYVWNNGITDGFAFIPSVGTTNYVLTGTDLNGCVNTDSIEILVNALPNVIANTDGNNICDGFDVTLTGFGAQSYVWDNGIYDGIAFIPAVGTSAYTVFGTDINGCVNQAFIDLVVYSLPPVDVVANMNGNLICEGTAITLSGSGAQSYSWNNGVLDGISFVPPVGINSFAVTGISANACLNYDSIQITVNPLPIVVANLSANNVCDGDSVTLSCSNLAFHSWNQNIVDGVPFIAPVGTTTFVLTATDFNGCTNKDSIDVIVHPLPIILANSSDNQVCEGNTLALFGTGAASYVWNNGVQDGVAFMPPLGISLYKVTGTDINGCVNEDDIAIQAYNLPVINPVSSDNIVCEGESVTLIGAGAQSYIWSNGILNGVSFVPAVGVNAYIVTGTDANACISSDTIQVRVNPLPNVLANASSIAVCENEAIQLFGSGANSYVWAIGISDGDSIMPNLGFNVYAVTGTDLNGCMNTDTIGIMTDSLGELVALEDIIVCDEENISISSFSNNTIAYQWGIIENGLGNDLVSSADYMGTTTSQLFVSGLSQASVYTFYLEMTGACGNLLYDTMDLMVNQSPIVDLLEDTILCIHDSNTIFADLPNGESFVWNDGTEGQYISPEFAGMYYVSFEENGTGCLVSDTMFIEMEDCIDNCVLLAPSGFSPNGDGTNDGFRAIHTCDAGLSFFDMKIFNRWGEMVFQTSDPEASWDGIYKGGKAPLATYGFIIDYVKEYESKREVLKGNVSLIR